MTERRQKLGWFCTNCRYRTSTEPSDPCPRCNYAIWEREQKQPPGERNQPISKESHEG